VTRCSILFSKLGCSAVGLILTTALPFGSNKSPERSARAPPLSVTPLTVMGGHPQMLTAAEFTTAVASFAWQRRIWRVDMHHTFHPDHARWREIGSAACCAGMRRYHVEERKFDDIAQHVSIAPDGLIWLGRDWNLTPASVGYGMNGGVFMFEMIGNFDCGHDVLEGAQLASTLSVIDTVQRQFMLPIQALLFHREVPQTNKTCPGTGVRKSHILALLNERRRVPMVAA
jgi:N-acetylmuramoyl-L-alanine amidase